jgi:hypothetical protein
MAALLLLEPIAVLAQPPGVTACDAGDDGCRAQGNDHSKGGHHPPRANASPDTSGAQNTDPNRRYWREQRRKDFDPASFDAP